MTTLAYWVNDLSPFLIRFNENLGIRYYGLAYVLGFVASWWLLQGYCRSGRTALRPQRTGDLLFQLALGVMIGGRLGYFLLYQFDSLRSDPLVLFRIWEGGMASHGGFVGVAAVIIWFARREGLAIRHLADLIVSTAPAGLFFGRVANFINGELWGRISTVPWAVIFPLSKPGTPVEQIPPRHPSQLYEAALEGALLLVYLQWRLRRTPVLSAHPGRLTGEFFIGYALVRMVGELFREPDAGLILGLSRGSFYSIFLILAGIAFWVTARPVPAYKK